jgi:hypothetical protein
MNQADVPLLEPGAGLDDKRLSCHGSRKVTSQIETIVGEFRLSVDQGDACVRADSAGGLRGGKAGYAASQNHPAGIRHGLRL